MHTEYRNNCRHSKDRWLPVATALLFFLSQCTYLKIAVVWIQLCGLFQYICWFRFNGKAKLEKQTKNQPTQDWTIKFPLFVCLVLTVLPPKEHQAPQDVGYVQLGFSLDLFPMTCRQTQRDYLVLSAFAALFEIFFLLRVVNIKADYRCCFKEVF